MPSLKLAVLFAVGLPLLSGCGGGSGSGTTSSPTPDHVTVVTDHPSYVAGLSGQAPCSVQMTSGPDTALCGAYATSNTAVLTVDSSTGKLQAVAPGSATITATATGTTLTGSVSVTVTAATVGSVSLTGIPSSMQAQQTAQAVCTVTMSNGDTNGQCTVASDAPGVASVSATNLITAVAPGTAHFIATSTADASKVSPSATLTVIAATRATPVIDSAATVGNLQWFSCLNGCRQGTVIGIHMSCPKCAVGDVITFAGNYWPAVTLTPNNFNGAVVGLEEPVTATEVDTGHGIYYRPDQYQGAYVVITDVPQDGTPASNPVAMAYVASSNNGAAGPNGTVVGSTYDTTYVWTPPSGSSGWTLSLKFAAGSSVVWDSGVNYYVGSLVWYDSTGGPAGQAMFNLPPSALTKEPLKYSALHSPCG